MEKYIKYGKRRYPGKPLGRQPSKSKAPTIAKQIAKQVDKAMNKVSESKVLPMTRFDETNPTPIQALAQAYTTSYVIGDIPTVWTGITGINSLTNMAFPKGDNVGQREGDSIFLKKSQITMDIEMNQSLPGRQVCEFRVIMCKQKRIDTPTGISHSYAENLFLDIDGNYFGHSTAGKNGTDLMLQPINRKYWTASYDKKFVLSPVADGNNPGSAHTGVNACKRSFTFKIPFNKKVSFNTSGIDTPDNVDYRSVVIVYAKTVGRDGVADVWETNVRGLTTYLDN